MASLMSCPHRLSNPLGVSSEYSSSVLSSQYVQGLVQGAQGTLLNRDPATVEVIFFFPVLLLCLCPPFTLNFISEQQSPIVSDVLFLFSKQTVTFLRTRGPSVQFTIMLRSVLGEQEEQLEIRLFTDSFLLINLPALNK